MQHLLGYDIKNSNSIQTILLPHTTVYKALEANSLLCSPRCLTLILMPKVWEILCYLLNYEGLTTFTLMWDNNYLSELLNLKT